MTRISDHGSPPRVSHTKHEPGYRPASKPDGVRARQDLVKQARYRISLEPGSEPAAFYRNLLQALGKKP